MSKPKTSGNEAGGTKRPFRWNSAMVTYAVVAVITSLLGGGYSNAASKSRDGFMHGMALGCLACFCLEVRRAASEQSVDGGKED